MNLHRPAILIVAVLVLAGLAAGAYLSREAWLPTSEQAEAELPSAAENARPAGKVIVSDEAQKNLGLVAKPLRPQTFWRTIQVPGMVVDRLGQSDRNVVAPAAAVVARIHQLPGDTVRPGDPLFTLKLLSEMLHTAQTELFKATQDIRLAEAERKRLSAAGEAIAESKLIDVNNQITRLQVATRAYRQELLNRGLSAEQIGAAAEGRFVSEVTVVVPPSAPPPASTGTVLTSDAGAGPGDASPRYELQELKVELGQQVQAGQTLCLIANHQLLAVEGRAFRDETPLLERSVREGWPVEIDFQEDAAADWPALGQTFRIRHLANTIDPVNRTFAFLVPLENQSHTVEQEGRTQLLWRFRPGQKVRVLVRVEKLDNVFVLPADAVAREGPEAFVFTQNVNTFTRRPARVLLQDRRHVVLANDGSLVPGMFVVQSGSAQLSRMAKAGNSGVPRGYHVHADGSLHKNEDEGK